MRRFDFEMIEQLEHVLRQPGERQWLVSTWNRRFAVSPQIHAYDTVPAREMRDHRIEPSRAAHRRMQQYQRRRRAPGSV